MKPGSSICEIGKAWISYGLSLFLLFTLDYLSEHSYSHTGLILFITGNLLSYLHFTFCLLYGWLNVSVPLIDLTIRAALGNHVIFRDWKGAPWRPELMGDLNWKGSGLIWKRERQATLHTMRGTLKKSFSKRFKNFLCTLLFTLIKQIKKQKLYNIQLSLPKQTKSSGSPDLSI